MVSENVKKIIENSLLVNKISHCYLIKSSSRVDLDDTLIYIINKLNNSKSKSIEELKEKFFNVKILTSDDESLHKENIKDVFEENNYTTINKDKKKILVLKDIELIHFAALNSILKTIEEPTNDTYFILTTKNEKKVLKTILSRSVVINVFKNDLNMLVNELKQVGFNSFYAHLFALIYQDFENVKKLVPNNYSDLVVELLKRLNQSFTKKQKLYIFLTKYNDKNTSKEFLFLLNLLSWLIYLNFKKLPEIFSKKSEFIELIDNLNLYKLNFDKFIQSFGELNERLNANGLFSLQTEKVLINLMECYHE